MPQARYVVTEDKRKPSAPRGITRTSLALAAIFRRHGGSVRYRAPNRPFADPIPRKQARTQGIARLKRTKVGGRVIFRLEDDTRVTVAVVSVAPAYPPVIFDRCTSEARLNLVSKTFHGKTVRLQPEAMAAFERAFAACPSVNIAADASSIYSGSFRSHATQKALYDAYKAGTGHLAAPPCGSWHEAGLAADILNPDVRDPKTHITPRQALINQGFHSFLPDDPPHHVYRASTQTNQTYPQPKWAK